MDVVMLGSACKTLEEFIDGCGARQVNLTDETFESSYHDEPVEVWHLLECCRGNESTMDGMIASVIDLDSGSTYDDAVNKIERIRAA